MSDPLPPDDDDYAPESTAPLAPAAPLPQITPKTVTGAPSPLKPAGPVISAVVPEPLGEPAPPTAKAPAAPVIEARLAKESASSPHASVYEQLLAMEQAEQAAAAPAARDQLFDKPAEVEPPTLEAFTPPKPQQARALGAAPPDVGGGERLFELQKENEPLELAQSPQWTPASTASARPPRASPPSAARPYQPLDVKVTNVNPPSRVVPIAVGVLVLAAVAVGVTYSLTNSRTEPVEVEPAPPPEPVVETTVPKPVQQPPSPPPVPTGTLHFTGLPKSGAATVFIDGNTVALPHIDSTLSVGRHKVRVEQKGFAPFEATVEVTAGHEATLVVKLKKKRR